MTRPALIAAPKATRRPGVGNGNKQLHVVQPSGSASKNACAPGRRSTRSASGWSRRSPLKTARSDAASAGPSISTQRTVRRGAGAARARARPAASSRAVATTSSSIACLRRPRPSARSVRRPSEYSPRRAAPRRGRDPSAEMSTRQPRRAKRGASRRTAPTRARRRRRPRSMIFAASDCGRRPLGGWGNARANERGIRRELFLSIVDLRPRSVALGISTSRPAAVPRPAPRRPWAHFRSASAQREAAVGRVRGAVLDLLVVEVPVFPGRRPVQWRRRSRLVGRVLVPRVRPVR